MCVQQAQCTRQGVQVSVEGVREGVKVSDGIRKEGLVLLL